MISDSLMEAIDADDEPAQAITERPPTQEYIESSLPENRPSLDRDTLASSVLSSRCFDVSGVVEAFIGQLTLAGSLSLSDPVVTDESDRCLKAGQVMCCSFPRQNRIIESQMARIVPSLFRVFEPDARGIPSKVLLHMLNRNDNPIEHILNGFLLWRS
ncbi:hypothetical protein BCR33DRAFT_714626 [Rhizoclosmatium globosum]|uniref:Uncharacterized protein n=1 Tax=Rhizoclosmatium globosum TaxID=329046 RepID=A0A1Y2CMH9_9FUNG|nr:hypothetical protein BCR33DRAFT_714626 [Rhizoclosmatium globosum]|eukprot:ORY48230.1 hypothetical protein BCR33DRAFT_714626 [Rhizoclosmatium globosum]